MAQNPDARQLRGAVNYHNGLAAEDCVARAYVDQGARLVARRWRGDAGEIDLIFDHAGMFVMVEVKSAATHDQASLRFGPRQIQRVSQSAEQFLASQPNGADAQMRIDLALVDQTGQVAVIENVTQGG